MRALFYNDKNDSNTIFALSLLYYVIFDNALFLLYSPRLHHVLPSSSLARSCAPLQFTDSITCSPPVPWLVAITRALNVICFEF